MKLQQIVINEKGEKKVVFCNPNFEESNANLVLAFGDRFYIDKNLPYKNLKGVYPNAHIIICSTSGQISGTNLIEDGIVASAIHFEKTTLKVTEIDFLKNSSIADLAHQIESEFIDNDLKAILILSEGSFVNGSELVAEVSKKNQGQIPVFGGLAGDGALFKKTIVGLDNDASQGKIVAVGFYGDAIRFGFSSKGGWTDFGPEREVTHSENNVLYKIGDRFALDLYKEYLGKYAEELPGSSMYFPLSMKENADSDPIVRTILAIDEEKKSMTFAGNIPQGSFIRLMKGNLDKIIDASYEAAQELIDKKNYKPELALLVSCVGRKVVLGSRIEEEIEVIQDVFGENTLICGFYSYGEISPTKKNIGCELHNQTMSITTLYEEL